MSEQEDKLQKDELTAAYLLGCHNTRKAYESRIKRYNHAVRREPYPMSRMYETAEGKYVQFEDYEALQQRLAAAEAKLPRWIPVGESMPTIAEPYVEYGEWVLGKERYYKVPRVCCRTWIDKEHNYWEWTAENGEVIDITHWMVISNTLDAATGAPKQKETE